MTLKTFIEGQSHIHLIVTWGIVVSLGLFNLPLALCAAVIASIGKELYDKCYGTGWSNDDILGDGIGIMLGVITLKLMGI